MRLRLLLLLLCGGLWACATAKGGGTSDDVDLLATDPDLLASDQPQDLRRSDGPGQSPDLSGASPDLTAVNLPDMAVITGCSVVPQSGCPAMMKCDTHDGTTSQCDPNGTSMRGQPCTVTGAVDSCVAGDICIDEGGGVADCRAFCGKDADCGLRSFCDHPLGMAMKFRVCTQPCNAIYPGAGCPTGLGCYAAGEEHTDCLQAGTTAVNGPCVSNADCQGGLICVGPMGGERCRKICPKGDNTSCGGLYCLNLTYGAFNWPTYGVCCPLAGC